MADPTDVDPTTNEPPATAHTDAETEDDTTASTETGKAATGEADGGTGAAEAETTQTSETGTTETAETDGNAEATGTETTVTPTTEAETTHISETAETGRTETAETGTDTEAAKTETSETSETPEPKAPVVTTPTWWEWVRRHRTPVLVVAGLVVVALVTTVVLVSSFATGPKDVVQDYMDAIHAGDTETALDIAGEPEATGRQEFLSADALADDWSVDAIVERHRRDDESYVDVTISAGGTSRQGRFHLVRGEDDQWTMESPYVLVNLAAGGLDAVELGSVRQETQRGADTPDVKLLLVFPGVYRLYPSLAKRITVEPKMLIATPMANPESPLPVSADFSLTDEGAKQAQEAINARVDECAEKTDIDPAGCPFNAEDKAIIRALDDVEGVTWTVVSYPEAHFTKSDNGGLALILRKPGTVTLTGTGVPEEPEGSPRTTFTTTCEFGLSGFSYDMTMDGLTVDSNPRDNYSASSRTVCF